MWRALFYATGAMLIILGVECIVFGRFAISSDSSLNKVVNKVLGNAPSSQTASIDGFNTDTSGYGNSRASRFGDPFSGVSNPNRAGSFSLPSYGGTNVARGGTVGYRIIKSEDWMPWSLIAIGTIVTLYTHSLQRNNSGH